MVSNVKDIIKPANKIWKDIKIYAWLRIPEKKKYFKNADRRAYPYVKQVDPGRSLLKGLRQRYHAVTFIYDNDKNMFFIKEIACSRRSDRGDSAGQRDVSRTPLSERPEQAIAYKGENTPVRF